MKSCFAVFLCFVSLLLFSFQLVVATGEEPATQAWSYDRYIVYTGAASSSSDGFPSDHILSSYAQERRRDRVIHRYSNSFSGFAAWLSEEEAKLIAQRPEVVSVFPDPVLQLHTTRSWDFLKEQSGVGLKPRQVPKSKSSLSGDDVIIGILDTGIWPEAQSFSDKGLGPIPKRWKGKCMTAPDFKSSNCNRKLIGARNYLTNDSSTSARDHDGHGTHVAAIAAGRPVPEASYLGLKLGTAQGGAPGARIAVYRVCNDQGCDGSAVLKAFDDAIADGVDVISVSLGRNTDYYYATDPLSIGAFHAVEKGVLVVSSSGDVGTAPLSTVLNVAPWILTVGATTIDRFFESDVVLGNNKVIKGGGVHDASFQGTEVPLIDGYAAKNTEFGDYRAGNCFADALDGAKVKGKMVLCANNDNEISLEEKLEAVRSLGGIGVIYTDEYGQLISVSVYGSSSPLLAIGFDDSNAIISYVNTTRNPVATISRTIAVANYTPAPVVAYFSGKGPVYANDYQIKPDVVAPGVDILSAWPSNETDKAFNILSGTSMASPHVAGIAALVKSQYPSWTPSAIKSAIMTTARQHNNLNAPITNYAGNPATPFEIGAGEVTMYGSLQPGLVYETEIMDYLLYMCYYGNGESTIREISRTVPANFSCPSDGSQDLISNFNYPSIAAGISSKDEHKTVKRTVTNVGDEESVYRVSVESSRNLKVRVRPATLRFTKNKKKLSYQVTFSYAHESLSNNYEFGSITWSNDKYRVYTPFVVVNHSHLDNGD